MSDKENPFGSSGDRTFVRPNPGLRRPPPAPPPPPSNTPPPAYTPQTAPAYHPPGGGAPKPAETPYGRAPASPFDPHAAAAAHDDWISRPATSAPAQGEPLQRAEDLDFEALVAPHENPIMRAAGPLLQLLGRLRVAALRASFASLMEQVAAAINFFEKDIRTAGVPAAQANAAKYLICATADDIVQNIPTDDRHVWAQYSMTSRFFGERLGGVNFFKELDRLKLEPAVNYNVLELQHACLALGFQGKYRATSGGPVQLQHIQRDLYETLRRVRPMPVLDLSPRWKGLLLPRRGSRLRVPLWTIAALAALVLLGLFLFLRMRSTESGEAVAVGIESLNPATPVALETVMKRTDPPPPPPSAQLQRCENAISGVSGVSCDVKGEWIKMHVGAAVLFESGKAKVLPEFYSAADAIARYVEKESGPIKIVGYTDSQPLSPLNPFRDNQALSEARAEAVSKLLRNKLSEPSRLQSEGRGPSEPVGDNGTDAGRRQNRRVDVWIRRGDK